MPGPAEGGPKAVSIIHGQREAQSNPNHLVRKGV